MDDPLTVVLDSLQISTTLYAMTEVGRPWGVAFPAGDGGYFHVVHGGPAWLRHDQGGDALELAADDVVLLAGGVAHQLTDAPDGRARVEFDPRTWVPRRVVPAGEPGAGPATTLVCGALRLRHRAAHPVLGLLPTVLHVPNGAPGTETLALTLRALAVETRRERPGVATVLSRLGDVLLVQLLRAWIDLQPAGHGGWLGAFRDPQIGAAMAALHGRPGAPWTVDLLAAGAGMSRSRFAARFADLVGVPPMTYLTRWRLDRAAELLHTGNATVREIGRSVGYESEPAFSRAFQRHVGRPPARYRAEAATRQASP